MRTFLGDRRVIVAAAGLALVAMVLAWVLVSSASQNPAARASATPSTTPAAASTPTPGVTSPSPAPTQLPSPTPSPTPVPSGPAQLSWRSASAPRASRIVWIGDRWLLVGSEGTEAATWTSLDGLEWDRGAPIEPAGSSDQDRPSRYWMTDVIAHDGELLAVGWNGVGHGDAGRAVSWSSADGEHWTFHDPTDTSFGGTYHFPTRLAHAPSGDVILVSGVGLGAGATIWVTSDGRQWTDRSVAAWEMTSIHDLAASDTVLVAIGMQFLADGGPRPQAWISSDAQEWTAVALPPEIGTLAGVTYDAVRDRFLLVGSDVRDRPTVWLTEDGRGWASTRFAGERGAVLDVEANEDGLIVAVGGLGEADEPEGQQAVAWASHDGVTWSINEFAEAPRLSLVAVGARVLAHSGWPDQPRTWVGEPR